MGRGINAESHEINLKQDSQKKMKEFADQITDDLRMVRGEGEERATGSRGQMRRSQGKLCGGGEEE